MVNFEDILKRFSDIEFVDRRTEVKLFRRMISRGGIEPRILAVTGVGGIGKSTLLKIFSSICELSHIPCFRVDCRDSKSVLDVARSIVFQSSESKMRTSPLYDLNRSLKKLESILNQINKLRIQNGSEEGEFLTSLTKNILKSFVPLSIPVVDSIKENDIPDKLLKKYTISKLNQKNLELLYNAERVFTENLISGFNGIAHESHCVIMFDTFEMAGDLEIWLREQCMPHLNENIVVVISGRKRLGSEWERWRPIINEVELLSFSDKYTRIYLANRGIKESHLVKKLFDFTSGHPMCLAISVDLYKKRKSIRVGEWGEELKYLVVDSLIERVMNQIKDEAIKEFLVTCSVVRYVNIDIAETLLKDSSFRIDQVYELVKSFSFVYPHKFGITFHDTVREYLREDLKRHSPSRFVRLNECAIDYFTSMLNDVGFEEAHIQRELLYHELSIDEEKGIRRLRLIFSRAAKLFQIDFCEQILNEVIAFDLRRKESQDWLEYYRAVFAFRQGRWTDQEKICRTLVQDHNVSRELLAKAKIDLGAAYVRQGKLSLANRIISEGVAIIRQVGTEIELGDALFELAKVFRWQGLWKDTFECFRDCSEIFRKTGQLSRLAEIDMHTALIYQLQGKWEDAKDLCVRSQRVFGEVGNEYGVGRSLFNLGWIEMLEGNLDLAEQLCSQSIDFSRKLGQKHSIGMSLIVLGDIYRLQARYSESTECINESRELLTSFRYEVYQGALFRIKGLLLRDQGDISGSLECLKQSQELLTQFGLNLDLALTLQDLGGTYFIVEDPPNSREFYSQALDLAMRHELKHVEVVCRLGMIELDLFDGMKRNNSSLDLEKLRITLNDLRETAHSLGYYNQVATCEYLLAISWILVESEEYTLSHASHACLWAFKHSRMAFVDVATRINQYLSTDIFLEVMSRLKRRVVRIDNQGELLNNGGFLKFINSAPKEVPNYDFMELRGFLVENMVR